MTSTVLPQDTPSLPLDRLPSPAPSSASPAPSPAPSESDIDVAREEAAIDAAISQSQDDDDQQRQQRHANGSSSQSSDTSSSAAAPEADEDTADALLDDIPPLSPAPTDDGDYEPPADSTEASAPIPAAPSSASKGRKRATPTPRPPPADPSVARATGAALLDSLLAKAAAYMSRTAVGADLAPASSTSKLHKKKAARGRMSEKEEDNVMLHSLEDEANSAPVSYPPLTEQPANITGKMRAYQLEGLNWMIRLYDSGVSGILADEMGLGKTLQSISLIAYLKGVRGVRGPHLVLTPLSTLGNWYREFARWCPELRVCKFHGNRDERAEMIARGDLAMQTYDVLLTSYEMAIREKNHINRTQWCFIIVDEAHRLKNENSLLSVIVRFFSSRYRLLLTGTPLQNNLHELWALLNFLLPDLFSSSGDFDAIFQDAETDNSDRGAILLQSLHRLLRPFMLRRMKTQVETDLPPKKTSLIYTGLSDIQRKLYKQILEKDVEALMGTIKERGRLMNMVMQLRKVADHPFLFDGVEEPNAPLHGEHLIEVSGKMRVLDKLLVHLQQRGSRVLIFSQMTRMLDILEDYMITRGMAYCLTEDMEVLTDRGFMSRAEVFAACPELAPLTPSVTMHSDDALSFGGAALHVRSRHADEVAARAAKRPSAADRRASISAASTSSVSSSASSEEQEAASPMSAASSSSSSSASTVNATKYLHRGSTTSARPPLTRPTSLPVGQVATPAATATTLKRSLDEEFAEPRPQLRRLRRASEPASPSSATATTGPSLQHSTPSASSSPLLFASLDPSTGHLVYMPATALTWQTVTSVVDFTHSDEQQHWAAGVDEYGLTPDQQARMQRISDRNRDGGEDIERYKAPDRSNGVSLVVDPQHDIFARVGLADNVNGNTVWSEGYSKVKAGSLLSDDTRQRVRMTGQAEAGLAPFADTDELPFAAVLGLTEEQVAPFLLLYGYWLGDGCLAASGTHYIEFNPKKEHDKRWVAEKLEVLGLTVESGRMLTSGVDTSGGTHRYYICDPRWVQYFFAEYGPKYGVPSATSSMVASAAGLTSIHTGLTTPNVKSVKWFWMWVWRLRRERARLVLAGLRYADGSEAQDCNAIYTSGYRFRDDIARLAIHAGYSTRINLRRKKGQWTPGTGTGHEQPIQARHDGWEVSYTDDLGWAQPIIANHTDIKRVDVPGGVNVWCPTVPPHNLIFTRRVTRHAGIVTQASKPIVVGNCRIDGNTPQVDREEHMRVFNEDGSPKFCFLLSTRAGGLGINLVTADTVILYDSDWNPQMDLQAMDRAHRIGQKKVVNVLRLVCEDTVEVQMLKRAEIKLHLDAMVIQQGRVQAGQTGKPSKGGMTTEDLTKMIRYGADKIFRQTESTISDSDILDILERGEQKAKEMDSTLKQHVNLLDLRLDGQMEDNLLPAEPGTELHLTPEELEIHRVSMVAEALGKRLRKQNYNEDEYYREVLKVGGRPVRTLLHKPFRVPRMSEHQFYDRRRIEELSDKEVKFYHRYYHSLQPPALRGLSDAEVAELEQLLEAGYEEWSFVDYQKFLKALRRYGRHQMDKIAAAMEGRGKSREQVEDYHRVFFSHVKEMKGGAALLARIERAERRQAKFAEMEELLDKLLTTTTAANSTTATNKAHPATATTTPATTHTDRHTTLTTLPLRYSSALRDRGYTLEEDRYLLLLCRDVGFGEWSRMCRRMERDEQFNLDWYLMARSAVEIERRVTMLLREIQKQQQHSGGDGAGGKKARKVDGAPGGLESAKADGKVDVDGKAAGGGGGHKRKADASTDANSKATKRDKKK